MYDWTKASECLSGTEGAAEKHRSPECLESGAVETGQNTSYSSSPLVTLEGTGWVAMQPIAREADVAAHFALLPHPVGLSVGLTETGARQWKHPRCQRARAPHTLSDLMECCFSFCPTRPA